jgi:hypothetical protein
MTGFKSQEGKSKPIVWAVENEAHLTGPRKDTQDIDVGPVRHGWRGKPDRREEGIKQEKKNDKKRLKKRRGENSALDSALISCI